MHERAIIQKQNIYLFFPKTGTFKIKYKDVG